MTHQDRPKNIPLSLQTNLVDIPDIHSIADFATEHQLEVEAFISTSNVNLTWMVRSDNDSPPRILSFGPKLSLFDFVCLTNPIEVSYFDPKKFIKVQAVCQVAQTSGVLCPNIIAAGFNKHLQRAWIIQEYAKGINLANIWNTLHFQQKREISYQVGQLLALLHTTIAAAEVADKQNLYIPPDSYGWYNKRISMALQSLKEMNIYSVKEVEKIISAMDMLLKRVTLGPPCILHGDILHKNIFIEQKGANHRQWYISSVIDWETAVLGGDPYYDIVLGAWWLSSKLGTWSKMKGSPKIFHEVISGYNDSITDPSRQFEVRQINEILALADLTWYVSILPFTICQSGKEIVMQRKQRIERIIETCAKGISYYDDWLSFAQLL